MPGLLNVHLDSREHLYPFCYIISMFIGIVGIKHIINIFITPCIKMLRHRHGIKAIGARFSHHFLEIVMTERCFFGELHMSVQIDFHKLLLYCAEKY
ncbi:hypothetical protein D3C80_1916910 [compost metagenome]